jgi:hypothetical protein
MSDLEAWGRKTEEEQKEAEESLRDSEANATHILRLVNGTLHMLSYMSAELPVRWLWLWVWLCAWARVSGCG